MSFNDATSIFNEINGETVNPAISDEKLHLINNANYALLQQCQQAIAKATDISPSIRKLVNDLITTENVEIIKNKLIAQFGS